MTNLLHGPICSIALSEQERNLARTAGQALADFDAADSSLLLRLENAQAGENMETMVPAVTARILADVLTGLAEEKSMTFIPLNAELSLYQAADILNVSPSFFLRLLEEGMMPFRQVREQPRVRYQDLRIYREAHQKAANAALEEMTAEAESLGLYK